MNLYRCLIEGENFAIQIDGRYELLGFVTTRFIRAGSPRDAEMAGLALLRADPVLDAPREHRREDTKVYFTSIEQVDSAPTGLEEPGAGYSFFPMGS